MTAAVLKVQCQVVGSSDSANEIDSILLEVFEEQISVRELIQRTVPEQVRALQAKHAKDASLIEKALARQYLSRADVDTQANSGAVKMPDSEAGPLELDIKRETQRAMGAFKDGQYMIVVDGERMKAIEDTFKFAPSTTITFVRLIPLIGG